MGRSKFRNSFSETERLVRMHFSKLILFQSLRVHKKSSDTLVTLSPNHPQTNDHIHHSENRKRSSRVCNPPYNHGPHSYILHLNYCKDSDYFVMVTYTGRTLRCHLSLSLFSAAASWPPSYPVFFCWVWRSLKYMVFTFPNSKLLFNEVIRNRPWFQHFTSVQTNVGIWFVDPMHVNWTTLTVEEKQSLIPNKHQSVERPVWINPAKLVHMDFRLRGQMNIANQKLWNFMCCEWPNKIQ